MSNPYSWVNLKDESLLKMRICDLNLQLEHSPIEPLVSQLFEELDQKGLRFRPKVYFGDEWFSPEGMLAISVPFYLAHPRLVLLEQKMMLEVEGGTPEWFMKLIRHEAGHCFDHAFRFSRRKKWRDLFGSPDQEYNPDTYHPRPYSHSFVHNLDNWYAQAHPDEDFAETFAVWMSPQGDWAKEYADWPAALKKLKYVNLLAKEVADQFPRQKAGYLPVSSSRMKTTLERYYARRKREHGQDYPDFFDVDLARIFNGDSALSKRDYGAVQFMKRNRKVICDSVSHWTGEKKFTINHLVKKLIIRCESMGLTLGKGESQTSLEVAAYLATLVTHFLFTGKFKRTV